MRGRLIALRTVLSIVDLDNRWVTDLSLREIKNLADNALT